MEDLYMAQMVIYIENETKQKIEKAAKASHKSASKWVTETCLKQLDEEWPSSFIDAYASVSDDSFDVSRQAGEDAPRLEL